MNEAQGQYQEISWFVEHPQSILDVGFDSLSAYIAALAHDLRLVRGVVEINRRTFCIEGELSNGQSIWVSQRGEFDRWGGMDEPVMHPATVRVQGVDRMPDIIQAYRDYGWDSNLDISRTDIWGHLVRTDMTAVQTLFKDLWDLGFIEHPDDALIQDRLKLALEHEKQQMLDSFIEGHNVGRCVTDNLDEAKECFEEWVTTYKLNGYWEQVKEENEKL